MGYLYKDGVGVNKFTFSAWFKVSQAELDASFAAGQSSWGSTVRGRAPIFTLGTTQNSTSGGSHTAHVDAFGVGSIGIGGHNTIVAHGVSGTDEYRVESGIGDPGTGGFAFLTPLPSGFSGTTLVMFQTADDPSPFEIGRLAWDFSGLLNDGHAAVSIEWDGFNAILTYSYDVENPFNVVAISPSSIAIRFGEIEVRLAEYLSQASREFPLQNFLSFFEFISTPISTTAWNHLFVAVDVSEIPRRVTIVLNNADKTIQTNSTGGSSFLPAFGGAQMGLPITNQEFPNDRHFSVGVNPAVRLAYVQIWWDQFIEPTAANLTKFFRIVNTTEGSVLKPPTDKFAAQKAFGASNEFLYRDKLDGVAFVTPGWATVGTSPLDFVPGPGQNPDGTIT